MREEFVEPMPAIQTTATLVFGKTRVPCYIVDVTVEQFRVAVPGGECYEGDPKLLLVSGDVIYPVRIIRQEPHAGGYSYRLQRIDEVVQPSSETPRSRFRFSALQCSAAGLIAIAVTSVFCIPANNERYPLLSLQGLRHGVSSWWTPSVNKNDRVAEGSSVDKTELISEIVREEMQKFKRDEPRSDVQTVSVSMISPASLSVSSPNLLPADESLVKKSGRNESGKSNKGSALRQTRSLVSLVEEGQVGRLRSANSSIAPWLFGKSQSSQFEYLRVSDAASLDLQQFELGLRGLSKNSSSEAIAGLRHALRQAGDTNNAKFVRGTQDVYVLATDDANVYFRNHKGTVELVRVLPIDFNGAE